MAGSRDSHVVEVPAKNEDGRRDHGEPQEESDGGGVLAVVSPMQNHPLTEISRSAGHLLLLKLWQREEDLFGARVGATETRLEEAKREVFRLCCVFFAFHGLFLTLLFATSVRGRREGGGACGDWWVPCTLSLLTSLALVSAVQARLWGFWAAAGRLHREKGGARALARCVQELRMKGASFDLSREPAQGSGRRAVSASVEAGWKGPLRWCRRYLVTVGLLCATAVAVSACKFVLCG